MKYDFKNLQVGQEGEILRVRLNRPEVRNALSDELLAEFDEMLDVAQVDDSVGVVTVTGNGPVFSAGHDLKELAQLMTTEGGPERMVAQHRVPKLERAWYFDKPLIAGVHGYVGPHAILLLSTFDFIIAADDVRFSFEQTRASGGMPASPLPLQIPFRAYLKLAFMGGWFGADAALRWDFVQRVVPAEELDCEVERWAAQAALVPREQVANMKALVHRDLEDLGLLKLLRPRVQKRPAGSRSAEYWKSVVDGGLSSALKARDEKFDSAVAEI
jgi:enoyl-CoA hydratase/carnithine racemase